MIDFIILIEIPDLESDLDQNPKYFVENLETQDLISKYESQ